MNESYGGNVPARIWARFMRAALAHVAKHEFAYPGSEVRKLAYCGASKKYEYFLEGTEPKSSCASGTYYTRQRADAAPAVAAPVAPAPPTAVQRTSAPVATLRLPRVAKRIAPAAASENRSMVELETPEPASAEKGGM
jgi:membrane peptidoglycan carboxypeptidase